MDEQISPEINCCYIDMRQRMFKVKMLGYLQEEISRIVIEDTNGMVQALDIQKWQSMQLIPCCKSSNEIQQIS